MTRFRGRTAGVAFGIALALTLGVVAGWAAASPRPSASWGEPR